MKKMTVFIICVGLFVMVTAVPGFTSQQEEGSAVAEETSTAEESQSEPDSVIEISGTVVGIDSDADGTFDLIKVQNHIISEYGRGLDLFEHVGKKISLTGELFSDGEGQVLDVIVYELVEDNPAQ